MKFNVLASTFLLLLVANVNLPAFAQSVPAPLVVAKNQNAEKQNNIKQLLAITGTGAMMKQMLAQMINTMKTQYPGMPQEYWDTFQAEMKVEDMVNKIVPIYSKHLSNEDIKGLITFYQSPLGKKTLTVLPQIMQESMEVGQQYGMEAGARTLQKLGVQR